MTDEEAHQEGLDQEQLRDEEITRLLNIYNADLSASFRVIFKGHFDEDFCVTLDNLLDKSTKSVVTKNLFKSINLY
jgi:hypothetical protein